MSGEQAHPLQDAAAKPERRQLFISYSHRDREWVERLRRMIQPLEQRYGLERWDDSRIQAGGFWREEIEKALARTQVALLMVSADFLASDFVTREELPPLFRAAKEEGLRILWVPLRPCLWKLIPEIAQYQAVIPPGRTLAEMAEVEQERAFVRIAEQILSTFQEEARRQAAEQKAEEERLAHEKEALERRAAQEPVESEPRAEKPEDSADTARTELPAPSPLRLQVLAGSLVSDGTGFFGGQKWRVETRLVEVEGYREDLADGVELTMIRIPAGGFVMGSAKGEVERYEDEGPQHPVRLEAFFLGHAPITQTQWKVVAGWEKVELDLNNDPANFKGPNRPVERVNWHEAMEFCRRLSALKGRTYTLPSEAQWEYACRAGTTTPFAIGETITPDLANYNGHNVYADGPRGIYRQQTTPVGNFPANAWGLQDMHGNVWEWCLDHWHASYAGAPGDGSAWLDPEAGEGARRLLRGGSWFDLPRLCRSAFRTPYRPDHFHDGLGFRVVCLPQD